MSPESECTPINRTVITMFENELAGIPEHLLINAAISVALLLIFVALKSFSWPEVQKENSLCIHKSRWISLLYADVFSLIPSLELERLQSMYEPLDPEMTFFCMLWHSFFKLKQSEIMDRCGVYALQYLQFLKCAIIYSSINTFLMLVVILPTNFHGKMQRGSSAFVKTSITNLDFRTSPYLWIHVFVAVFLIIVSFAITKRFSSDLLVYHPSSWTQKTVVLKEIRHKPISSERIEQYLGDIFPHAEIAEIKLAYEYNKLILYGRELRALEENLDMCNHIFDEENRIVYIESCFSRFCTVCCISTSEENLVEDARTYYGKRINKLNECIRKECNLLSTKILQFAFVTFHDKRWAVQVLTKRSFPHIKEDKNWKVVTASDPDNILWENLNRRSDWNPRTLIINTVVFLLAVFMTTGPILMASLNLGSVVASMENQGVAGRFFSSLLTYLFSIAVPTLVMYSSTFLDFETKSSMNRSIMMKSVIFLIFSIVVLPSLALPSIGAIFSWNGEEDGFKDIKWQCIFLPDNGAFFVSYIISASFIGSTIQLLRLSEVFFCLLGVLTSKSEAEKTNIRRSCIFEYSYGIQYSYCLLIFALVQFFSIMCPIIAPFGLIYFLMKYCVDRYNIYFSSLPTGTSAKVHSLAIQFIMLSTIMKIIGLFLLMTTRGGMIAVANATLALLIITSILYLLCLNPFSISFIPEVFLMPHKVPSKHKEVEDEDEKETQQGVFQPFALTTRLHLLESVDKYNNPVNLPETE